MSSGLLLQSNVRPSYRSGFARSVAESAYPNLWDGLVGAWCPGLGNTGDTIHGLSRAGSGAPTNTSWITTQYGSVLDFDGSSNVVVNDDDALNLTTQISIVAWLRWTESANLYDHIAGKRDGATRSYQFRLRAATNALSAITTTGVSHESTSAFPIGEWAQAGWTFDGTSTLWINATSAGTDTGSITGNTVPFRIGDQEALSQGFEGQIHSVLIYNRVLTANEFTKLYVDPLAPFRLRRFLPVYSPAEETTTTVGGFYRSHLPSSVRPSYKSGFARSAAESASPNLWDGLVGAWCPALGNTGSALHDLSGHGGEGTLTNMDPATDWVGSVYGPALSFDGTNDYVSISDASRYTFPDSSGFSISAWIRPTNFSENAQHGIVAKASGAGGGEYYITWVPINQRFYCRVVDDSTGAYVGRWAASGISAAGWHHIVYSYNTAGGVRIWVDGAEKSTTNSSSGSYSAMEDTSQSLTIGVRNVGASECFEGQIGTVLLYSHVLLDQQIAALYRDPLAPFRLRRWMPLVSAVEEAGGWQAYWAPRITNRILGGGLK